MRKEINLTYTGYNISDMLNDLDSMFTHYSNTSFGERYRMQNIL